MYIYIYMYVYVCMCVYIYIYMYTICMYITPGLVPRFILCIAICGAQYTPTDNSKDMAPGLESLNSSTSIIVIGL